MSSSAAPAYRRMSVEQRRTQLLAAAVDLFGHRRPEDVSIDDVAAAAGVSRPLVYRYFPGGKQQLYEAAVQGAAQELTARFAGPSEGPATQRLSDALERYLAVTGPGPRLAMMVHSWIACVEAVSLAWLDEAKSTPLPELRAWLVDHFTALLLVTATTDPETAAVAAAALHHESPTSPATSLAARLTRLLP